LDALANGVELEVLDPVGLSLSSVMLHLNAALADDGLAGVPVTVRVTPVVCVECGRSIVPEAGESLCPSCGWPLPRRSGHPLRITARA
jgi:hypothetical protein